ncbi:MAG: alpha/beta hydrolase [Clostridiales bacterium]|jgi:pimeloyl-ACP methyl ester carboxylesterase|nr:alpha/beta hydrolase [Clostridiales bacterium]
MSNPLTLNDSDLSVIDAKNAEQRLYDYYGLKPVFHYIRDKKRGIKIRVCEIGTGDPVLIVPGNTGDSFPFVPLIAELRRKRILAFNRPGGGLSEGLNHLETDFRQLAVDTLTLVLDHFAIEKLPIISHSMGSHWSLWFALDKPERVEKLILLGVPGNVLQCKPPFVLRLAAVRGINKKLFDKITPKSVESSLKGMTFMGHSQQTLQALPEAMKECYYYFPRLPHYRESSLSLMEATNTLLGSKKNIRINADELKAINQKVLLVWGSNDPFGSVKTAEKIAAVLPDARLEIIRGGGHLTWLDDTVKCGELTQAFLDQAAYQ